MGRTGGTHRLTHNGTVLCTVVLHVGFSEKPEQPHGADVLLPENLFQCPFLTVGLKLALALKGSRAECLEAFMVVVSHTDGA